MTVSSPAANEMAAAEALAELGIFRDPWVYMPNGPVCWTGGSGGACASTDPAPQPPGEDGGDEADEEDPWDDDLQRELENELAELGEDEGPAGAAGAEPGAGLPSKKPTTAAEAGPPAAGGDGEAKGKEGQGSLVQPGLKFWVGGHPANGFPNPGKIIGIKKPLLYCLRRFWCPSWGGVQEIQTELGVAFVGGGSLTLKNFNSQRRLA